MIEKTVKTIEGKIAIKIPSQLNELTLGQLMAMQEKTDMSDLDAISILSGVAVNELQNIKNANDLHVFGDAVLSLSTQLRHLYNSDEIPKKVTFYHEKTPVEIKVINNLAIEPAGAFLASRDIIATEINEHIKTHGEEDWQQQFNPSLKACCHILAHYFYCRVTGERYNEYKIEAFYDVIKQLRVTEALPIAKHFFMSYPNLSKLRISFWLRLLPFWKRRRAFNPFNASVISTPSTPLQTAM